MAVCSACLLEMKTADSWFSPTRRGILVNQVQLRQKKGNRWLFKLPKHHLDYALDRMAEAFEGFDIHLVDGGSAVEAVRSAYKDKGEFDAKGAADRIRGLYDRPLDGFRRGASFQANGVVFHTLARVEPEVAALAA